MEITTDALPWDSEDTDLFRAFLQTRTGQRLIPKLAEQTPPLLAGGDTNSICVRSGEVRGFGEVIKTLLSLAVHPPYIPKPSSEYPSLDDDEAHHDGQKINPE